MRGDLQCSAAQTPPYTELVGSCQQNVNEGSSETEVRSRDSHLNSILDNRHSATELKS